ncbi:MAG: hypothetical protein EOO61_04670 [Hymenobacter sp.]|nr:MAG: hypothetical protein EOO61_04670 [Hymenobacter sp.]
MTWLLTRTIALTTLNLLVLTLFRSAATQAIDRQRLLLEQLDRILGQVRKAQMMHPSLLVSQYGSVTGYLKEQLLADDWLYVQGLRKSTQAVPYWLSLPSH